MIGDRYVLQELYASGAQSRVWKGLDKITGDCRIIKTGVEIRKEAILARSLVHPLVAYPYDFGVDPEHGQFAVYPEFLGKNSLQWIKNNGERDHLKHFVAQVAEVLSFLHQHGWLYNDFKPEHFLIHNNSLKVIDLGLCSEMKSLDHSNTFSGTFPFISPERLNGRPFDQRSDIFAFGILLLHLLLSEDSIPVEPSMGALQTFLYKANSLKEPWKGLVLQMTALEPAQRISSASELRKKIMPAAEKVFASIPAAENISIPPGALNEKLLCVYSQSETSLEAAYNRILIDSWQTGTTVYSFHLNQISPEDSFQKLCMALTGMRMSDPYTGFRVFQERKDDSNIVLIFRSPELLTPEQRAMFFFGTSCLAEYDWIKMVLLSTRAWISSLGESWKHFALTATGEYDSQNSIESLTPANRKILNALAIAGGKLSISILDDLGDHKSLTDLQQQGFVSLKNDSPSLVLSADLLLSRMRLSQKAATATRMLQKYGRMLDPIATFHLATHAGNERLVARSALFAARKFPDSEQASRFEWYWNAFASKAKFPRRILFRLANAFLRSGDFQKARKILMSIRKRFGDSFQFADLLLNYLHRKYKLESAIRVSARYAALAHFREKKELEQYFLVRQAGFQVLNHDFIPAGKLLDQISMNSSRQVEGLHHHFRGLLYFFHGNLSDSLNEFRSASKIRHRFRTSSIMNIGVALGKMGKFEKAEKWLHRSIGAFSKIQDKDRLSHAFSNLGMVYQFAGKTEQAKKNFLRTIHLSRACRNRHNYIHSLNNMGTVYENEGRIDKAIAIRSRVFRLAGKWKLPVHQTFALTNAGLHLGYKGRFRKAIRLLKQAIHVRSEMKLKFSQAHAYEYLAITYFLARHFNSSERAFLITRKLFHKAGCDLDPKRVNIFLALVYLEKKETLRAQRILQKPFSFEPNSFEEGMQCYARAVYLLETSPDKQCLASIHDAERVFRRVPSLFWLAKVHKLKSEFYRRSENYEKTILSLQAAYHLFSRLGSRKELQNLPKEGMDMQIYQDFLERLAHTLPYKALQMVKEILSVQEVDAMVTRILDTALELTSMDRAILILNEEPLRVFKSASLAESHVQDILDVSRSVLKSATESGKSVLCFDASADPLLQNRPSIINNRILSVVCLPLRGATGKPVGCLYLDSCEGVETLAETEKILLEIFSAIVGLALSQSLLLERSVTENKKLRNWLELRKECPEMIGNSPAIHQVLRTAQSVVDHSLPIMITGETGTGKELVARILHYSSKRKNGPFVAVNCAAFSRELLESELFGHEKGSFTGAMQQKKGVFEQAQDGTLLLDEIGEMPLEMQAKLLRVLQGGEYRRIGGVQTLSTNARVILATNRNLEEMVSSGTFREDLYYRIKVVDIPIPALRYRSEDIPMLATAFLKQAMLGSGKNFLGFTHEALEVFKLYSWPGNVRQLKSEIERIVALNDEEWINVEHLDPRILRSVKPKKQANLDMAGSLSEIEKRLIHERLTEHGWNVVLAAKSLGITRHGLYSKMKRYNISNPNR